MKLTLAVLMTFAATLGVTTLWHSQSPSSNETLTASAAIRDVHIERAVDDISGRVIAQAERRVATERRRETADSPRPPVSSVPAPDSARADQLLEHLSRGSVTRITDDMIDRVLDVAGEIDPELASRLQYICDTDPREFRRVLQSTGRRLIGLAQLKERAPDLYDMKRREWRAEVNIARIARDLVEARESADRLTLRILEDQLRTEVKMQFVMDIKARGDYLNLLEEHVEALRNELERKASRFDETVEERVRVAIDQAERQLHGRDDVDFVDFE